MYKRMFTVCDIYENRLKIDTSTIGYQYAVTMYRIEHLFIKWNADTHGGSPRTLSVR